MDTDNQAKTQMQTALGSFCLQRYPHEPRSLLQAWDSADLRLIEEAATLLAHQPSACVWIINDNFGALATALHAWQPWLISDSIISHRGCEANRQLNHLPAVGDKQWGSMSLPPGSPDLVLIRIPKSLALLEHQLHCLQGKLGADTPVIGGAMAKHLVHSVNTLFATYLGRCNPSLAVKKARLLRVTVNPDLPASAPPFPSHYTIEEEGLTLLNHASLFSRQRLDIGTRLLLSQIPHQSEARRIIDLGCGNGVLGIIAARRNRDAELVFIDESLMAIDSARQNFSSAFDDNRQGTFLVDNCLDDQAPQSADLIVNNPPFHQQHTVGAHIAEQMFRQSHKVLRAGGQLLVIGNRQLGYHQLLNRIFGNCQTLTSNRKFVVLQAVRH